MSLNNFFRINFPYGMVRNEKNEWMCFNREYMPIGFGEVDHHYNINPITSIPHKLPIFTAYKDLSELTLIQLADPTTGAIRKDSNGKIDRVYFYNDNSNPTNNRDKKTIDFLYEVYFGKLKVLSELMAKNAPSL